MRVLVGTVLVTLAAAASPRADGACEHTAARQATLDAKGATKIEIVARAGTLVVEGRAGLGQVEATGTACAPSAATLERIRIVSRRQGTVLHVEAEVPEPPLGAWGEGARLDLRVDVPDSVALDVSDGSGELQIRHVGALALEDGSGAIVVEDVRGDLSVDDGSGEMRLTKVAGDVRLRDGSGAIFVRDVGGSVVIDEDGSGGIDVAGVRGSVNVRDDSSGSIDVADVGGDFTVGHDSTGGIHHRGVRGKVSLPAGK